jgi:hypothetical protein
MLPPPANRGIDDLITHHRKPSGRPRHIKLRRIAALRIITKGATVVTDGLKCADAGCRHVATATGSGRKAARHPAFKCANTMLGNMSIAGTYRAIRLSRGVRMAHQPPFDLAAMMRLLAMPPSAPHPPLTATSSGLTMVRGHE